MSSLFVELGNSALTLKKIMAQIKMLTGVVEVGLFCKVARAAYFGNSVSRSESLPEVGGPFEHTIVSFSPRTGQLLCGGMTANWSR